MLGICLGVSSFLPPWFEYFVIVFKSYWNTPINNFVPQKNLLCLTICEKWCCNLFFMCINTCYSKCVLVCIGLPFSYQWHCIWQSVCCSYPLLCLACFGLHVTQLSPCCLHRVSADISLSIKSWHLGLLYTSLHVAFSSGSLPSSMIVGLWVNSNCMQDFSIVHRL